MVGFVHCYWDLMNLVLYDQVVVLWYSVEVSKMIEIHVVQCVATYLYH